MSQTTAAKPLRNAAAVLVVAALPLTAVAERETAQGLLWNVQAQSGYDDNVYRSFRQEESDGLFVLEPKAALRGLRGSHQFDIGYAGAFGRYFNESELDYTDHAFKAHALLDHSARLKTEYTLGHDRAHDEPGSTDAVAFPGREPNEWRNDHATGKFEYGRADSTGQLVGELRYEEFRYTNNDQEFRDNDATGATGTFYYRLAPRTRLLFELDYAEYDYRTTDLFGSDQSGDETRYLTGVTWEATAKTTGVLKFGYRDRTYDDDRYDSLSGLALQLDGTWKPTSHTTFTFGAARENQESAQQGTGGYLRSSVKAGAVHDLTPRTRLKLNLDYSNDDFEGGFDREDDGLDFSLGLDYNLLRWLDIGAEYRYEERDSDLDIFDYTANVFMLTARTTF